MNIYGEMYPMDMQVWETTGYKTKNSIVLKQIEQKSSKPYYMYAVIQTLKVI